MVDISGIIWAEYEKTRQQARAYEEREDYRKAAEAHRHCAELLQKYSKNLTRSGKQRWLGRAHEHLARAERLASGKAPRTNPEGGVNEADYEDAAVHLITKSTIAWDDIAGLDATKRDIKLAYGLALAKKPDGVSLDGWRRMLFYGPPGTGKTLLAAATSNGLGATFFSVKVSDLVSKYFGESTRLISALFAEAYARAPSVIFLDEFDALTPSRGSGESGSERRILSTLLAELDGLATKDSDAYVLTIAATNTPWDIDSAILSRFEKMVHIPLPDAEARRQILEINLRGHTTTAKWDALVARTQGFAGRDIARLCKEAIGHMLTKANVQLTAAVDAGKDALSRYQVQVNPLTKEDFAVAFSRVKPGTTSADSQRYISWADAIQ